MHPKKWKEYQSIAHNSDKMAFLQNARAPLFAGDGNKKAISKTLFLTQNIVNNIVISLLADYDNTTVETQLSLGLKPRVRDDGETSPTFFSCYIPNYLEYELILQNVEAGLSFTQVSQVAGVYRSKFQLQGKFGNVSRLKVSHAVRIFCAESFQIIAKGMNRCWAFSIALDGGNKQSTKYLDFRIRLGIRHEIFNLHLIAAPMPEQHTGNNMFQLASKLLDNLCPSWRSKIIGVTTDGASNMVGRYVGVATQIQNASLPGFYRVWCAAHQLDLIVQARLKQMYHEQFIHHVQSVSSFLKRRGDFHRNCPGEIPGFVETRLLSMGKVLKLLTNNRVAIVAYDVRANKPPPDWWIDVFVVYGYRDYQQDVQTSASSTIAP